MPSHAPLARRFTPVLALGLAACTPSPVDRRGAPDLLVMVVVDQLGADLLARYEGSLHGGFRRLLDQGAYFPRTAVPYALSNSGPGHASLATGTEPFHHGIVDNGWMEPRPDGSWRYRSAVADSAERIVGGTPGQGASPRARLASTLGDWARAADARARVLVIGQGPTSANTLAPFQGGEAYWFSPEARGYVTSTFYVDSLPDWVGRFNVEVIPRLMEAGVPWTLAVPEEVRALALPDDTPWEGDPRDRVFPHLANPDQVTAAFVSFPALDQATLRLAEAGIHALGLGRRGSKDVLMINLSSLDEVGHSFGPWSLEQLDALLRVDGYLGRFLSVLDDVVGPNAWALALSADHGAPAPPEQVGPPAVRISLDEMDRVWSALAATGEGREGGRRTSAAVAYLEALPYVADVYTIDELLGDAVDPGGWLPLYRRSFREDRILDFPFYDRSRATSPAELGIGAIRLTEGSFPDFAVSVHGSPYGYDRTVPFLLTGPGVPPGRRVADPAAITDVAPTLADLGGVPVPGGVDGRSLAAAVRSR